MSKSIQDRYGGHLVLPLVIERTMKEDATKFIAGDNGFDDIVPARALIDRLYEGAFAEAMKIHSLKRRDKRYQEALDVLDKKIERLRKCGLCLTEIQEKIAREEMI